MPSIQSHGLIEASPRTFDGRGRAAASVSCYRSRQTFKPRLLACVDDSLASGGVAAHAVAIARSLGLEVALARVIESSQHLRSPADPIEWYLRRESQLADLGRIALEKCPEKLVESVVLAGSPADELSGWALEHGVTLLALARRRRPSVNGLGSTAQNLLDQGSVSLLLVPPTKPKNVIRYRRVLVPIDGSARAESVLPLARRIARAHGAELILAHVVPQLDVVDPTFTPHVRELCDQIVSHNERGARRHLEALRAHTLDDGLDVRIVITGPGDPRVLLHRLAIEQQVDLVVLSSHGRTGLDDVPCGSVAEYLAIHAPTPVLVVRPNLVCGFGSDFASSPVMSAFRFE